MKQPFLILLSRYIYSGLFYFSLPLIYFRLLWRSRRLPAYRSRWLERLARFNLPIKASESIWLHAVSLGESIVAEPLISQLKQRYPHLQIIVTTTTPTGSQRIHSYINSQSDDMVFHVYAPYDLPSPVRRFLKKVKPRLAIFIETELWPNYLHYLSQLDVPVMIANARLSEKSARSYARLVGIMQYMLSAIAMVAAQSPNDQKRFIGLGLPAEKVIMAGNIKFDIQVPGNIVEQAESLRQQLGKQRQIWIAASSCAGEEPIILAAFAKVKQQLPQSLLFLVPRHPDRFDEVIRLCQQQGFNISLRQPMQACSAQTDIFIGNTIGELLLFYAVADLAFIGGSLVNKGGHNMLEAAAFALPIISGNSIFNFEYIAKLLNQDDGLIFVDSADNLAEKVCCLLHDSELREYHGQQALALLNQHRGAVACQLSVAEKLLEA